MTISPANAAAAIAAATACQTHFDNLKAAFAAYDAAWNTLISADGGKTPLVMSFQIPPLTKTAAAALMEGKAFDFTAAANSAWSRYL
ncbi:hypothetical protein EN784_04630 [bacterium M00.F.Ca.ET.141.01.1.1]|nr:hypothetical protein EN784_04630 [bacterium M00.F.Ca.ET.141.01.1.1]